MKKALLILITLSVALNLNANEDELNRMLRVITNEIAEDLSSFILDDSTSDSDKLVTRIIIPEDVSEQDARESVRHVMNKYNDIELYKAWSFSLVESYIDGAYMSTYQVKDTPFYFMFIIHTKAPELLWIFLYDQRDL